MASNNNKYYQINSIVKLFRILETLVSKDEWDLAKLANEINIPKTTVLRMLLTLKSLGYVDQNELGKRYYATAKLFDIGSKAIPNINIIKFSQPIMARLADKSDETVYLSILSGIDIVVVAKISSRHYLKVDSYVGDRMRSYQSSSGKAMLTGMTSKQRADLFSNHRFEQMTSKGISSFEELEAELSKILSRGYSLVDEEKYIGIRSVAVPIFDHQNEAIAAISVLAPKIRLKMKDNPKLAGMVTEAANEITQKLGGTSIWSMSRQ